MAAVDLGPILRASPVIPVLAVESPEVGVPLARALVAGGLRVLEITLRTPRALEVISAIIAEIPEAIVGSGTVLREGDLDASAEAGAAFAVSPGLTPRLAQAAVSHPLPVLPGVASASEAMAAWELGFSCLKLFPAVPAGGLGLLKALWGPLPMLRFCPTGGIDEANAGSFLGLPNVLCVGGSWVAPASLVASQDWDAIERLSQRAAQLRPQS
jgi:2-dehydro-3-deoxyphosphogluconate aldolase/(4S)-4-hydroxy-2-oxoglutarate aldolase